MIALDQSENDKALLKTVSNLAGQFLPSQIHVVHVQRELDFPKEVLMDIPDLHLPDVQDSLEKIKKVVTEVFHPEIPIEYHILKGNALTELLKFSSKSRVGTLFLGRTDVNKASVLSQKIVRKAPCSVMLVPIEAKPSINTVLIPIDFSVYSDLAFSVINVLEEQTLGPQVHVLHVYKDATKYLSQVFETADEIDRILAKRSEINKQLEKYAKHELDTYLEKIDKPSVQKHIAAVEKGQSIAQPIDLLIDRLHPDLVVIGSKGKGTSAATLLGGVSETVFKHKGNHITLILKQPGENQGFLRNIFR